MREQAERFFLFTCVILTALSVITALSVYSSAFADSTGSTGGQPTTMATGSTVKSKLVARHTTEYIEKPVATVKYVERVRSEPVVLRNFHDPEELKLWLEYNISSTIVYLQPPDATVDCDDFALALQQKALRDGFIMSFEIIEEDEYNALFENTLPSGTNLHAINLVIIGNRAYYIDPQTGETVLAVYLD